MANTSLSRNQPHVRYTLLRPLVHLLTLYQYTPGLGPLYDDVWFLVLELAHDCATNTPDPRPLRLVSKSFQRIVQSTPSLWHHIVRRVSHFNPAAVSSRIRFATGAPLILSIELEHGDELESFSPIFREHKSRWHSIEIHGCDLSRMNCMFNGCALSNLESLSFLPCREPDDNGESLGIGLWIIRPPRLRFLRIHISQLRLVSSNTLERLYVDCTAHPDYTPLPLTAAFKHLNLTHLLLSDVRTDSPLPRTTLPCLTKLILFNVYADAVRPLLDVLDAPQIHTLAVTIAISSPFFSAHVTRHMSALCNYQKLQLVHLNQAGDQHYVHVLERMFYSLGWAFPSTRVLQTNLDWGTIATALNPTPADIPFHGQTGISLSVPFPRIETLVLRDGTPRSLGLLAQSISFRAQTSHAITQCGVESHLLRVVSTRLSPHVETVEWNRDLDAEMQPLYLL